MYQQNSQFFPSQQASQSAQRSSTYLQQQLPQGYTLQNSSVLSQLQQQQLQQQQSTQIPLQQSVGFTSSPETINALRRPSKVTTTQQVDNLHLPNLSARTSPWLLNGSSVSTSQQAQQWQHHSEHQASLRSDQRNFNAAHSSHSKNLTVPLALRQSSLKLYDLQSNIRQQPMSARTHGNGLSQAMQQSQTSRLRSPPVAQRLASSSGLSSNLHSLQPSSVVHMQHQLLGRSISIPPNNIIQSSNNSHLHSSPNRITSDAGINFLSHPSHQSLQQAIQSGVASKSVTPQNEKRDKIHIRFDQKKPLQNATAAQPTRQISKNSDDDDYKDEPQIKVRTPLAIENNVRIVIDDDIEIVGTKEAEIMSHIRSDCPIHPYERVERVDLPPTAANIKCCSKCFCYLCDKLAEQCDKWKNFSPPHCNANTKSSCWKARRNIKKSPLVSQLTSEELNSEISRAGEIAIKYIILIREAYITYRNGTPCDFHLVPCECPCHRSGINKDVCSQCKAVHDTKRKFNYEPVRTVILEIIVEIKKEHLNLPYSALVLFEALLSELCSHRPADFNHVTRMPSNPNPRCQCNTPQIMEEHIEMELIKLFVLHEISPSFKEKFIKCVKASVQPLQLKDIMKKFFDMRHWNDPLLQDVLNGHTVTGKYKNPNLKEDPLFIEMRVKKLTNDEKFREIVRYLEVVKNSKPTKNAISDGTSLTSATENWLLESLIKGGMFKEGCIRLINTMRNMTTNYALTIFTLLSGQGLPAGTKLTRSFNPTLPPRYEIAGVDRTVLLLVFMMFMESDPNAQIDIHCYLWLAKWVNRETLEHNQNLTSKWMKSSTDFFDWSRKVLTPNFAQHLHHCKAMSPQAVLFTCSTLIIQFMNKIPKNMDYVLDVIDAYKNNEWALFYMFTQPTLLRCGNHHLITWLTNFMKSTSASLTQFSHEAFRLLIKSHSFLDVCLFMQQWVSPVWVNQQPLFIQYFLDICSIFAERVLNETAKSNYEKTADWLSEIVFQKMLERNLQLDPSLLPYCEIIGQVCCYLDIKNISLLKKMSSCDRNFIVQFLTFYQQKFQKNLLKPEEIAYLLRFSITEGNATGVKLLFAHYLDKHECPDPDSTPLLIMKEVIDCLQCQHYDYPIKKDDVISLYSRLFSHEALSWLICAKCSAKMPDRWIEVLRALAASRMTNTLFSVVDVIVHQFTMWMKELCVQEKADIDRLLRCLNIFITNFINTLINHCSFNSKQLQETILQTAGFVANPQLQQDYVNIIHSVFRDIQNRQIEEAMRNKASKQPINEPENLSTPSKPQHVAVVTNTALNPVERVTQTQPSISGADQQAAVINKPKPSATVAAAESPSAIVTATSQPAITSSISNPPSSTEKPTSDQNQTPLKLTINKSRLSISKETTSASASADKNVSSPIGSPTTCCPQCGDPMSTSFRCSKCHSRKSVDIRCPNCNELNQDLKGYSCRFCYASLLEVLTTGEVKAPEKPSSEKSEPEKKKKKLKRKKTETPVKTVVSESSNSKPPINEKESDTGSKSNLDEDVGSELKRQRIKTVIHKDNEHSFSVKPTVEAAKTPPSRSNKLTKVIPPMRPKSHQRSVISKISVDDLTPQPPKPHQRAKEAQQKERTHSKVLPPPRQDRNLFSSLKESSTLSESSSDSDSDFQVSPLVLRRKSDAEPTSTVPEKKVVASEHVHSSPPMKRPVNQGSLMSKKQKTILNRMKQVGRSKAFLKQPKTGSKSPGAASTEWEVTKRRKPGPKSKTSYYTVNPGWAVPRYIKIPYTLDMPKVCKVQLSHFPQPMMRKIRHLQPNLKLKTLYA